MSETHFLDNFPILMFYELRDEFEIEVEGAFAGSFRMLMHELHMNWSNAWESFIVNGDASVGRFVAGFARDQQWHSHVVVMHLQVCFVAGFARYLQLQSRFSLPKLRFPVFSVQGATEMSSE